MAGGRLHLRRNGSECVYGSVGYFLYMPVVTGGFRLPLLLVMRKVLDVRRLRLNALLRASFEGLGYFIIRSRPPSFLGVYIYILISDSILSLGKDPWISQPQPHRLLIQIAAPTTVNL